MQRDPRAYMSDILEAAAAIQEATSTIDEAGYGKSRLIRSAVEREFIIIGEALKLSRKPWVARWTGSCNNSGAERPRRIKGGLISNLQRGDTFG